MRDVADSIGSAVDVASRERDGGWRERDRES